MRARVHTSLLSSAAAAAGATVGPGNWSDPPDSGKYVRAGPLEIQVALDDSLPTTLDARDDATAGISRALIEAMDGYIKLATEEGTSPGNVQALLASIHWTRFSYALVKGWRAVDVVLYMSAPSTPQAIADVDATIVTFLSGKGFSSVVAFAGRYPDLHRIYRCTV